VPVFGELRRRGVGMQQMVGIQAMDHIYEMRRVAQRVRQPVQLHRVPSESIWWIERSQVEKIQRPLLSFASRIAAAHKCKNQL
jgi:hypothetical protein